MNKKIKAIILLYFLVIIVSLIAVIIYSYEMDNNFIGRSYSKAFERMATNIAENAKWEVNYERSVAVVPILEKNIDSKKFESLAESMVKRFQKYITQFEGINIFSRSESELNAILREHYFQMSDFVDAIKNKSKIGQFQGTNYLLGCSIKQTSFYTLIEVKIISVEKTEIIHSDNCGIIRGLSGLYSLFHFFLLPLSGVFLLVILRLHQHYNKQAKVLFDQAVLFCDAGELQKAQRELAQLKIIKPHFPRAEELKQKIEQQKSETALKTAKQFFNEGKFDRAREMTELALQISRENFDAQELKNQIEKHELMAVNIKRAKKLVEEKHYEEAWQILHRILEWDKDNKIAIQSINKIKNYKRRASLLFNQSREELGCARLYNATNKLQRALDVYPELGEARQLFDRLQANVVEKEKLIFIHQESETIKKEFHVFTKMSLSLGRDQINDIVVLDADECVSRRHARLGYDGRHFILTDLNSSNGTRVNGRVIKEIRLKNNDIIDFAESTKYLFSLFQPLAHGENKEKKKDIGCARLKCIQDGDNTKEFILLVKEVIIGRDSSQAAILINDRTLKGKSARIIWQDDQFWLENLSHKKDQNTQGMELKLIFNNMIEKLGLFNVQFILKEKIKEHSDE